MANLESLVIEIDGSASNAQKGITRLMISLAALGQVAKAQISPLQSIASALQSIKQSTTSGMGNPMNNIVPTASATSKVKKATVVTQDYIKAHKDLVLEFKQDAKGNLLDVAGNPIDKNLPVNWNGQKYSFASQQQNASPVGDAVKTADTTKTEMSAVAQETNSAAKSFTNLKNEVDTSTKVASKAKSMFEGMGKAIGRVGRIFSTMLIRTALKSLMKAFSESWSAAYQFSKAMGGDFAQSVDKAKTLMSGMATNIISAFSPAISALVPVLQAVSNAVMYLCNAIKSLFSMLGMSSDLFGASTDAINSYSKAAGGGGKANKEMLASFDELNVISQESGGGGGGGGGSYVKGMFSDIISDEMAKIQLIVGESLLALGLILACTGHIPIGVALMAVGAAAIVKTVVEDWGKLSAQTQAEISEIMAIVGGASLVVGAILAFSGANIPLGIGLMALGAVNMGTALGLNWDDLVYKVRYAMDHLSLTLSLVWAGICVIVENAWNIISKWWNTSGIGKLISNAWGGISSFFKGLWENISGFAHDAWILVGAWWKTNVSSKISNIWDKVKEFFSGLWTAISTAATTAWDAVKQWWESTGISQWISRAWADVGNFLKNTIWDPVKNSVTKAWDAVKKWWEDSGIGGKVRGAWASVVVFLRDSVWNPIKEAIINAWNQVKKWWEDSGIGNAVRTAWQGVLDVFNELYGIVQKIKDVIDNITGKKTVEIATKISTEGTRENYTAQVVSSIAKSSNNLATSIGGTLLQGIMNIKNGSSGGHGFASGAYGIPRGEIFVAQEAGAELIGEINGKTSVANQGQIIEGISSGVERANAEQNVLLRQQNDLLRGILEKEINVSIGASANFGRTAKRSIEMYNAVSGG